jgi:putative outer membrane protein, probably involved in nutrient binding
VQQVYDQMIADLTVVDDARFQITPDNKTDADKAVASAYLAKIYACQGNWLKVQHYALIATEGPTPSLTPSADVQAGKWDISMNSWLWGFDITQETRTYWNSFYAHMDNSMPSSYAGGGAFKLIYSNLYAKIGNQDVRKKLYINETLFDDIAKKYRAMNPHLPEYANVKYVTNSDFTSDYCYLRREDPYLLYIEALVENNLLDEAKAALKYLVKDNREDIAYDVSTLNQEQLREEVRLQRRIELWGEGTSFFDWKRWKTGINRYEAGSNHLLKVEVPAESEKWIYQIPKAEMESNPNMIQNE